MTAEMQRERPAPVRLLEGGRGDLFRVEALGQQVADLSRPRAVGRQPRDHGGGGQGRGVQAFRSFRSSPTFTAAYPTPVAWRSTGRSSVYPAFMPQDRPQTCGVVFQRLFARLSTAWAAFCTGLSPALGPRRAAAKALDSLLEYKKRSGWNADDGVLLRRAHPRGGVLADVHSIERRHLLPHCQPRHHAGHRNGAARRPRSVKHMMHRPSQLAVGRNQSLLDRRARSCW